MGEGRGGGGGGGGKEGGRVIVTGKVGTRRSRKDRDIRSRRAEE